MAEKIITEVSGRSMVVVIQVTRHHRIVVGSVPLDAEFYFTELNSLFAKAQQMRENIQLTRKSV